MFGWKKKALRGVTLTNGALDQVEQLTADLRQVSGASGRLAADLVDSRAALVRAHQDRDDAFKQITALVEQATRKDRVIAGLSSQLDHALGYTAEELAILDARRAVAS